MFDSLSENNTHFGWFFIRKSYTFDVLFNNKDEMLDLKQLTVEVCRIATEAGHFLKEERKKLPS